MSTDKSPEISEEAKEMIVQLRIKDSKQQLLERLSDGLDEHQFHEKDCASVYEFIPDGEYQECDCNIERVKALIQEEKERL